ncbi:MAG: hypothetical protein ACJAZP_001511 [Psychromonas sp.]|jgi:hypothetical protein
MFFPVAAIFINWLYLSVAMTEVQLIGAATLEIASTMVQHKPKNAIVKAA